VNNAVELCFVKSPLKIFSIPNVCFDEFESWIGEVRPNIRALDRRTVKVVEVIDYCDAPAAFGQQAIDEM